MKKIFSICLILVVAVGFVACSDNDDAGNSYLQENTIKVIASNLTFSPLAQTGGVKFTAPAGSTVSVDEDGSAWAKAEVRGDSVVVSVSHNPRLDSRSAILTIKNGADFVHLSILQAGAEFSYKGQKVYRFASDDAQTLTLPFTSLGADPVLESPDMAALESVERKDSAFIVKLKPNETNQLRKLSLYIKNQGRIDTVFVMQAVLKDFTRMPIAIVAYDLLKMNASVTDLSQLVREIHGHIKIENAGGNEYPKFVCEDPEEEHILNNLVLAYRPETFTFVVSAGAVVNQSAITTGDDAGKTLESRTTIWDSNIYNYMGLWSDKLKEAVSKGKLTEAQYQEILKTYIPQVYLAAANSKLTMLINMDYDLTKGMTIGTFEDGGAQNLAYAKSLKVLKDIGYTPIAGFEANMMGIDAYVVGSGASKMKSQVALLASPMLLSINDMVNNAKAVQAFRARTASFSLLQAKALAAKARRLNR